MHQKNVVEEAPGEVLIFYVEKHHILVPNS